MKYLNTLLENKEIDSKVREKALEFATKVGEKLLAELNMDDDAELMFSNHILALIKRIETKEFVDEIEEEMMDEVSKEALQKAENAVGWLFKDAGIDTNRSEIFLVATHIEMAMQKNNN